jgi:hypothetical protein
MVSSLSGHRVREPISAVCTIAIEPSIPYPSDTLLLLGGDERAMPRILLAALLLAAPIATADDGGDQFRALVCVIDRNDGRPCSLLDAEALARIETREAAWEEEKAKREAARQKLEKLPQSSADGTPF